MHIALRWAFSYVLDTLLRRDSVHWINCNFGDIHLWHLFFPHVVCGGHTGEEAFYSQTTVIRKEGLILYLGQVYDLFVYLLQ